MDPLACNHSHLEAEFEVEAESLAFELVLFVVLFVKDPALAKDVQISKNPSPTPTPTPKPVWGWANAKGTIKTTYDSATNGSNIPIEIPNMPVSGETCDGELTGYGKSTDATEEAVWNYLDNKFGEDFCGVGHLKVVDGSVHW